MYASHNYKQSYLPDIPEDEVEVSDDDLQFIKENRSYASLLSTLDTHSITKFDTFFQSSVLFS